MAIRVYELAKELKIDSASLISKLEELNIGVKSHASAITEEQAQMVKALIQGPNPKEVVEQRLKPGVIRRRVMRPTKEEEEKAEEAARASAPQTVEEYLSTKHAEAAKPAEKADVEARHADRSVTAEHKAEEKRAHAVAADIDKAEKKQKPISKKQGAEITEAHGKERAEKHVAPAPTTNVPSSIAAPETKTEPSAAKPSLRLKNKYTKPLLRKEQSESLQKVDEEKPATPARVVEKETAEEEKKRKKKKKGLKDEVVEETPPVKKAAVKGTTRRREVITRQDLIDTPDTKYRPLKKRKGMPKKTMKKTLITTPKAQKRIIRITETIQVGELARRMGIKVAELLKKLFDLGIMASINQYLNFEEATLVAADYGYEVENVAVEEESLIGEETTDNPENCVRRPPVVTVMGHVDHGKTTLLDTIRKANVVDTEKGGITQHIGAYTVHTQDREICFIDTPGHEAFTSMRARGAQVTDIVVLVVAADDGVMDRTKEAVNHAKAAEVPIIVAVNKIDKPEADPEKVKRQMTEMGLMPEEWGGETMFVNISAKFGKNISELLETIILQADVLELAANPTLSAKGVILEAKMDKGYGPMATTLVQKGTLKKGDVVVAGTQCGRIRIMFDPAGNQVAEAGPARAVAIVGISGVPQAGDVFNVVKDEKTAKQVVEFRLAKQREIEVGKTAPKVTFDELYERLQTVEIKDLKVVLKADVQGSVEAITDSLKNLSTDKCKLNIVHAAAGTISEHDVMLASATKAIVLGFNVKSDSGAKKAAESEKIEIRLYGIIYELLDEVRKIMEGSLESEYVEKVIGHAEVRAVFDISRMGKIAGSYVTDGKVVRNAQARVLRDGAEIWKGKIAGLKRFKDDAREVAQGNECGIKLDDFDELQEKDVIEAFSLEEVRPTL